MLIGSVEDGWTKLPLKSIVEVLRSNYRVDNIIATKSGIQIYKDLFSEYKIDYTTQKVLSSIGNLKSNSHAIAIVRMKDTSKKKINLSPDV